MKWKVDVGGRGGRDLAATPAQVWAVLSDPTRVGEWSHECHTVTWIDGYSRAEVGAKFRGNNQVKGFRWSRTCTITELEPERLLVYRTSGRPAARLDGVAVPPRAGRRRDPDHPVVPDPEVPAVGGAGHRRCSTRRIAIARLRCAATSPGWGRSAATVDA